MVILKEISPAVDWACEPSWMPYTGFWNEVCPTTEYLSSKMLNCQYSGEVAGYHLYKFIILNLYVLTASKSED